MPDPVWRRILKVVLNVEAPQTVSETQHHILANITSIRLYNYTQLTAITGEYSPP